MKDGSEYRFTEDELNWVAEHLDDAAGWTREGRILRNTLIFTVLLGLAMHVLGFAIAAGALGSARQWPVALAADLLVSLGTVLWTAAILVDFLEVWPRFVRNSAIRYYRGAVAALRQRGDPIPAEAMMAAEDQVQAKLDAILRRLDALDAAVSGEDNQPT